MSIAIQARFRLCHRLMQCFLLTLLILALTSCNGGIESGEDDRVLNRGLNGDPESLDPHHFTSTQAANVLRDIGEGLLGYSESGELRPGVAESWEVSPDGRTYTFFLRPNAKWSNGESLFARDFVRSFQRLVDPQTASPSANNIAVVREAQSIISGESKPSELGVLAVGDHKLVVELESRTPYFLQLLTHPSTFPVYVNEDAKDESGNVTAEHSVSNGAYVLSNWSPGHLIRLEKNQSYYDNLNVWFDVVNFHVLAESAEILRYRAGELDITGNVDSSYFESMKETRPTELRVAPYLGVYYYGFNLAKPPFASNRQLRQALSMAIDRELLVSAVTKRGEVPAYSWVPPGIENYEPQELSYKELAQHAREAEAKRLYAEAGYGPGNQLEIELRFNTLGGHKNIAVAIQSMWRDVLGVETTLINEEFRVLLSNIVAKDVTQVFRLSWTGDYNDPHTFLQLFDSANPNNLTGYSNSKVDRKLELAASEGNLESRAVFLSEAERLALNDHPVIPLYFFVNKHMVAPSIVGWESNPLDFHYSKHLRRAD